MQYRKQIIYSKNLKNSFILLVIQQLIVASSSLWLAEVINNLSDSHTVLYGLSLYLTSLILPYIPGALALVQLSKAQILSFVNYIDSFAGLYPGKIKEWSNKSDQIRKTSIISGEAFPTITGYIDYLYHLSSSSLNIILNLITLTFLISPFLIIAFITGIFLSLLILFFQKRKRKIFAVKAQQSRINFIASLINAWDNILLNNTYNYNIWINKFLHKSKRLLGKTVSLEIYSQSVSILMAFALMLPTAIYIGLYTYQNIHNIPIIAVVVVTLPRLFQILTYSYEMLFLTSSYPMQNAKLTTVLSLLNDDPDSANKDSKLENRVSWEKIRANSHSLQISAKSLLEDLPKNGKVTLQGENGSGKTSLLLSLKQKYGDDAFYLPAKHDLMFNTSHENESTGQKSIRILKEIKENIHSPLILLDEWDANIDGANRSQITILIDELSKQHFVVETLHAKDENSRKL